ncbi:hypothetical protein RDV78_04075 [Bacillota bacterium LX-D]|nr:hypothetical protein [Bacillota bacterium LX-D]
MKDSIKRIWLKIWPKSVVTVFGVLLYFLAVRLPEDIKGLLVNVAASLISIPVIFIAYELWNEKSHRALNERVYRYAENEMSQAMLEIRKYMEMLLEGYCVYFDYGDIIIDDSNPENYILHMNDEAKILYDEDGEPYQLKYQLEYCDEVKHDTFDLYELEKDSVGPVIADVQYLGYQIADIDLEDIVDRLDELLKHSFIMERMDDEESSIIIHLLEASKMLHSFVEHHKHDLFLRTNIKIKGFALQASEYQDSPMGRVGMYSLYYREEDEVNEQTKGTSKDPSYEQLLDKKIIMNVQEDKLLSVYVVNPDYYIMFGDLITEVLSCIRDWRETSAGAVVTDYESGWIGPL